MKLVKCVTIITLICFLFACTTLNTNSKLYKKNSEKIIEQQEQSKVSPSEVSKDRIPETKPLENQEKSIPDAIALIQLKKSGFSPNNDGVNDSIEFNISISGEYPIQSWSIGFINKDLGIQKLISGMGPPPKTVTWDGMGESFSAAEGIYSAVLTVYYANKKKAVDTSSEFRLALLPPFVEISIEPKTFSSDGINNNEVIIRLESAEINLVEKWKIDILDPMGTQFVSISGADVPESGIRWNGRSATGEKAQSYSDYTVLVHLEDRFGNKAQYSATLSTGAILIKQGNDYLLRISSISFSPYSADYLQVDGATAEKNLKVISDLAETLKKYPGYQVKIESHTPPINLQDYRTDSPEAKKAQTNVLIPLSKLRAETLKKALIDYGIPEHSIIAYGFGASQPIVPFSDNASLWKNRRFDIILVKF